ncbi:MAG: carboxypeptidase regulatory-like domain-containing protein [Verrucomicrobiales bacterium]|nr:carboxypeptidase regulatory-like domain-containing protein [Verrucomicrobiales bacterium]
MNLECGLRFSPEAPTCQDGLFRSARGSLSGRIRFWGTATDHVRQTYHFDISDEVTFGASSQIRSSFSPDRGEYLYFITGDSFWIEPDRDVAYAFEYVADRGVLRVWIALQSPFSYPAEYEHYDFPARHLVTGQHAAPSCLQGTVLDEADKPVPGVAATLGSVVQTANASGVFHYSGIPSGAYLLVLRKPDFEDHREVLDVPPFAMLERTFRLQRAISLRGVVVQRDTGMPLAGASVMMGLVHTITDELGRFEFRGVPAGHYTLTARKAGFFAASSEVSLPEAASHPRTIVLERLGGVSVVGIRAVQYPGLLHFLGNVPLNVEFEVQVDWGGREPSLIHYLAGRRAWSTPAVRPVRTVLDVGDVIPVGGSLEVYAEAADGYVSWSRTADLVVAPPPLQQWGGSRFVVVPKNGRYQYQNAGQLNVSFFDVMSDSGLVPEGTPMFEGLGFTLAFLPSLDCTVDSTGAAQLTLAWNDLPDDEDTNAELERLWNRRPPVRQLVDKLKQLIRLGRVNPHRLPKGLVRLPCEIEEAAFDWFPYVKGELQWSQPSGAWQNQAFEVGLGGELSSRFHCNFITLVGTFPLPWYVEGALTVSGTAGGRVTHVESFQTSVVGTLGVEGRVAGGVGIDDLFAGEVWGKGSMTCDFRWPERPYFYQSTGSVAWGLLIHAFLWTWEQPLAVWEWTQPSPGLAWRRPPELPLISRPLPRTYLDAADPACFLGGAARRNVARANPGLVLGSPTEPRPLVLNTFPFPEMDLSCQSNRAALVWLHDDPARPAQNRTVVQCALYAAGTWSNPTTIAGDGTPDFHPRVRLFEDGQVLAVWEETRAPVPAEATFDTTWPSLEVSAAWLDPAIQAWSPKVALTHNGHLDRSPRLAGDSPTNAVILWVANPGNRLVATTEQPDLIMVSRWGAGGWSTPRAVAEFTRPVLRFATESSGAEVHVVFSVDTDGRTETIHDHELFYLRGVGETWEPVRRLTQDEVPDDNPQVVISSEGELVLAWLRQDEFSLARNLDLTRREIAGRPGYSAGAANFRLLAHHGAIYGLAWVGPGRDTGSDVWVLRHDKQSDTWSEPKALSTDEASESGLVGGGLGPDAVLLLYSRREPPEPGQAAEAGAWLARTDLYQHVHEDRTDLGWVEGSLSVWPPNPRPGTRAEFVAEAVNHGDRALSDVVVVLEAQPASAGLEPVRLVLPDRLRSGTTVLVRGTFEVPTTDGPIQLQAILDPEQLLADVNRTNNLIALPLLFPDLRVHSPSWFLSASNEWTVQILVANEGALPSLPCRVHASEVDGTGAPLAFTALGVLRPGETEVMTLVVRSPAPAATVDLVVEVRTDDSPWDFDPGNNILRLYLATPPAVPPLRLVPATREATDRSCFWVLADRVTAFAVEVSSDLRFWSPLHEFHDPRPVTRVCDPPPASPGARFYRARRLD